MSYSLLSKFRGAWLGSIFGQQLAISGKSSLTEEEKLIPDCFLQGQFKLFQACKQNPSNFDVRENLLLDRFHPSKIVLKILPVVLYYHDDWFYLTDFLIPHQKNSSQASEAIDDILIWSYVVRLALRGKLIIPGLTDRVVVRTKLQSKPSVQWLKIVEMSCLNSSSATQLIEQLPPQVDRAIPLSLFCVLNNSQSFSLAVAQASSLEDRAINTTALSGAISGAYNGLTALPVWWRNENQQNPVVAEIMIQTETMLADWLGMEQNIAEKPKNSVITAPKTVQIRQNLRIVSQQEYE